MVSLYFRTLDKIAPSLVAKKIFQLMSKPRIKKKRDFEEAVLEQAEQETIRFQGFDIQTYQWGNPEHKVALCIHGWEGQAGNFGGMVEPLLAQGYQVIAFDAPSHGRSSNGEMNMFDIVDLAEQLAIQYQPEILISHSFGSVVSAMTLKRQKELKLKHWFMITTPQKYVHYIKSVTDFLGVSEKTFQKVVKKNEEFLNISIQEMDMAIYCQDLDNVAQATIIHSVKDKIIPIDKARVVHEAFEQSEMIELDHLGHYSILWSDETKAILTQKLAV